MSRGKQREFSTLDAHQRRGKTLTPPLMQVPGVQFLSWYSERLPEMLWAALLTHSLPRDDYMRHLSSVAKTAMRFREDPDVYPEHTVAARLSQADFETLFDTLLADQRARAALSPLLLLEGLPDRAHWQPHLAPNDEASGWATIGTAVLACLAPRDRPSINIRWLRVMFLALQHRLQFLEGKGDDIVQLLCDYPENTAEPSLAEATIGSMEMITGSLEHAEPERTWSDAFWKECFGKTECTRTFYQPPDRQPEFDYEPAKKRWGEIYVALYNHFFNTIDTTAVDARHDGVFGLALYAMSLVTGMMRPFSTRASGRHLLRSLAEVYITLAYLVAKDDADLWLMYRNYGSGQAKLALLKFIEGEKEESPKHINVETLEQLANEDVWQEYLSIDLGHWAKLNVRGMAIEAGVKDAYDAFFEWPSGFVHGHWGAVRDSVYDICWNPLHRFHRIPRPMRVEMEDVCFDAISIMNRTLDLVHRAYPSFTIRFELTLSETRPSGDA